MEHVRTPPNYTPTTAAPRDAIIPFDVVALQAEAVTAFETQSQLEWAFRNRAANGLTDAFRRIGRKRVIDVAALRRCIREQAA